MIPGDSFLFLRLERGLFLGGESKKSLNVTAIARASPSACSNRTHHTIQKVRASAQVANSRAPCLALPILKVFAGSAFSDVAHSLQRHSLFVAPFLAFLPQLCLSLRSSCRGSPDLVLATSFPQPTWHLHDTSTGNSNPCE